MHKHEIGAGIPTTSLDRVKRVLQIHVTHSAMFPRHNGRIPTIISSTSASRRVFKVACNTIDLTSIKINIEISV